MSLPNVKMLLLWLSRMHIYGFIENHTFLEQFVSMGVRDHFFHMVDQYFGNDSLEPFESKFIGSTGLAMAYLWLSWPSLMRGYETIFQYVGIFVRYFLWRGVLYCFPCI